MCKSDANMEETWNRIFIEHLQKTLVSNHRRELSSSLRFFRQERHRPGASDLADLVEMFFWGF